MPDWKSSMQQTFEFYVVDPTTWKDIRLLDNVKSCTINRESDSETLGSATFDIVDSVGECYIRVYLITIQNGIKEKHPLGTYLVQTPSSSFDGRMRTVSMDAYTPLLELKEKMPPIGYFIPKKENVMDTAFELTSKNLRAPVVKPKCDMKLYSDFVADVNDTWVKYLTDLIAIAKYTFSIDEMGRILFAPKQEVTISAKGETDEENTTEVKIISSSGLQPVWTYDDSNSSILYPEFNMDHDLYGIPNVVEVVWSNNTQHFHCVRENHDPNSPTSIENRGRRIVHRVVNPDVNAVLGGTDAATDAAINAAIDRQDMTIMKSQVEKYTTQLLRELSTIEYTVSYTHGYCPVRVGDCVRLNYARAGIDHVNAKVISQSIKCEPGCPVSEKAVFTTRLWG